MFTGLAAGQRVLLLGAGHYGSSVHRASCWVPSSIPFFAFSTIRSCASIAFETTFLLGSCSSPAYEQACETCSTVI